MVSRDSSNVGFIRQIPKNTILFREGSKIPEMCVVLKGAIEVSKIIDGKKVVINEVSQGGFLGELTLFLDEPSSTTAVTSTDTIIMTINHDNFEEIVSKNPKLANGIITEMAKRIKKLKHLLEEHNISIPAEQSKPPQNERKTEESPTESANKAVSHANGASASPDNTSVSTNVSEIVSSELDDKDPQVTAEILSKYCFNKMVSCPVCGHKFETFATRDSRLKQVERTNELRTYYQDIEPMFFNIWVCPECYYAMKKTDFEKLGDLQKKNLANHTALRKEKYHLNIEKKFSYGFTLQAYRLAIDCLESLGKKDIDEKVAGLWLNIAWMYDDLEEAEKALEARKQALTHYNNAYIFGTDRTDNQDQKIEYLLGTLSATLGNYKEAKNYLFKVASRRNGHPLLKQLAQDGLEDIKKIEK